MTMERRRRFVVREGEELWLWERIHSAVRFHKFCDFQISISASVFFIPDVHIWGCTGCLCPEGYS